MARPRLYRPERSTLMQLEELLGAELFFFFFS